MIYGYARVSTDGQSVTAQVQQLHRLDRYGAGRRMVFVPRLEQAAHRILRQPVHLRPAFNVRPMRRSPASAGMTSHTRARRRLACRIRPRPTRRVLRRVHSARAHAGHGRADDLVPVRAGVRRWEGEPVDRPARARAGLRRRAPASLSGADRAAAIARTILAVLLLLGAVAPTDAWAHASLLATEPADGSHLDRPPNEIR